MQLFIFDICRNGKNIIRCHLRDGALGHNRPALRASVYGWNLAKKEKVKMREFFRNESHEQIYYLIVYQDVNLLLRGFRSRTDTRLDKKCKSMERKDKLGRKFIPRQNHIEYDF